MNPYVDPVSGTNYNKLGITDRAELKQVEYALTTERMAQLAASPIAGKFDMDHWRALHHHIFKDVYEWAGKERTMNFSKLDPVETWWRGRFAPHDRVHELVAQMASEIKASDNLRGLTQSEFAAAITKIYVMANYAHPFPEGNGRSTQTLLSQLAREAGYELRYGEVDRKAWNQAAARSMPQVNAREPLLTRPADSKQIHAVFKAIVRPLERAREPGLER